MYINIYRLTLALSADCPALPACSNKTDDILCDQKLCSNVNLAKNFCPRMCGWCIQTTAAATTAAVRGKRAAESPLDQPSHNVAAAPLNHHTNNQVSLAEYSDIPLHHPLCSHIITHDRELFYLSHTQLINNKTLYLSPYSRVGTTLKYNACKVWLQVWVSRRFINMKIKIITEQFSVR